MSSSLTRCWITLISLLVTLSLPIFTQAGGDVDKYDTHLLGVFLGATSFDEKDGRETEATYGVEYELRFLRHISVGAVYESSPDAHHGDGVDVQLLALYYRPDSHWRFGIGYGEEKIGGDHPHDEVLKRLCVTYDFHLAGFGIAPTFAADFVDDHTAYVAGVTFSKGF